VRTRQTDYKVPMANQNECGSKKDARLYVLGREKLKDAFGKGYDLK
jgi:hypothetical protein